MVVRSDLTLHPGTGLSRVLEIRKSNLAAKVKGKSDDVTLIFPSYTVFPWGSVTDLLLKLPCVSYGIIQLWAFISFQAKSRFNGIWKFVIIVIESMHVFNFCRVETNEKHQSHKIVNEQLSEKRKITTKINLLYNVTLSVKRRNIKVVLIFWGKNVDRSAPCICSAESNWLCLYTNLVTQFSYYMY